MSEKLRKSLLLVLAFVCMFALAMVTACSGNSDDSGDSGNSGDGGGGGGGSTSTTHTCTEVCPVCGGCTDWYCEYSACSEKCGDGRELNQFMATNENAILSGGGYTGQASDGTYYYKNMGSGSSLLFTITSSKATTVSLVIEAGGLTTSSYKYTDDVDVMVNGTLVTAETKVPYADYSDETEFFEICLGCVSLVEGDNTILISPTLATNSVRYTLRSLELYADSDVTLSWSDSVYAQECDICGICTDPDCVGTEDYPGPCTTHCMCDHTYKNYFYAVDDETVVENGTKNVAENQVGFNNNANSVYITFNIYSSEAVTNGGFYFIVCTSPKVLPVTDVYTIYVNGIEYTTDATIAYGSYWSNYHCIYLGGITLNQGDNVIQFVTRDGVKNSGDDKVYMHNLRCIIITADVELTYSTTDWSNATLTLDTSAVQTEFTVGDEFDYTGLTATVNMGDGSGDVDVTSLISVSVPELSSAGTVTITVRYGQLTQTYDITVKESPATLTIDISSVTTEFELDAEFSYSGLVAMFSSTGKDEDAVDVSTEVTVSEPDMTSAGEKTVTVTYGVFTATYTIKVKAAEGVATEYIFQPETDALLIAGRKVIDTTEGNYAGALNNNKGAQIVFTINADSATTASLVFAVSCSSGTTLSVTDNISVSINGVAVTTLSGSFTGSGWASFTDVTLGDISLSAGINVLIIEVTANVSPLFNLDCIKLTSTSFLSLYSGTAVTVSDAMVDGSGNLVLTVTDSSGAIANVAYVHTGSTTQQTYTATAVLSRENVYTVTISGISVESGTAYAFTFVNSGYAAIATTSFIYTVTIAEVTDYNYSNGVLTLTISESTGAIASAKSALIGSQTVSGDNFTITAGEGNYTVTITATITAGDYTILFYDESGNRIAQSTVTLTFTDWTNATTYTFEAEDSNVVVTKGLKDVVVTEATEAATGYLGSLYANNMGAKVTFYIYANEAGQAILTVSISNKNALTFTDFMSVTVNGVSLVTSAALTDTTNAGWYNFLEVELGEITLVKGVNVIEFEVINNGSGFNFDSIKLKSNATLSFSTAYRISVSASSYENGVVTLTVSSSVSATSATINGETASVTITDNNDGTYTMVLSGVTLTEGTYTVNLFDAAGEVAGYLTFTYTATATE